MRLLTEYLKTNNIVELKKKVEEMEEVLESGVGTLSERACWKRYLNQYREKLSGLDKYYNKLKNK